MTGATVAVLCARADLIYKTLPDCDVYDAARDARSYSGHFPVVAHPPCAQWGRLSHLAHNKPAEKSLGPFCVGMVRQFGGVVEHPEFSRLWLACEMPRPSGGFDRFGGWTLGLPQFWFGHRAEKLTWLYIVGTSPTDIPSIPFVMGEAPCVVDCSAREKGHPRPGRRPFLPKREREATPLQFALWLVDLARRCRMAVAA